MMVIYPAMNACIRFPLINPDTPAPHPADPCILHPTHTHPQVVVSSCGHDGPMGAHSVKRLSKLGMVPDVPGMAALDMNSVSQLSQPGPGWLAKDEARDTGTITATHSHSHHKVWWCVAAISGCVCVCGVAPRAHSCPPQKKRALWRLSRQDRQLLTCSVPAVASSPLSPHTLTHTG